MSADTTLRATVCGILLCGSGLAIGAEEDAPDPDFLEYLGMWEESDEDWMILDDAMLADNEERSDPAPDSEESPENEDES